MSDGAKWPKEMERQWRGDKYVDVHDAHVNGRMLKYVALNVSNDWNSIITVIRNWF
jgi:hypothetical protein